nr:hypothetical protein [Tanacetum cinerariifolium]
MRNNRLYELSVYSGKVMLFRFRVSLNLLPGTLQNLAMSLCPDLGTKGSVDHESVNKKSLEKDKEVGMKDEAKNVPHLRGRSFQDRQRPVSPKPASGSLLAKRMLVSLSHDQTNGVKDQKEERGK